MSRLPIPNPATFPAAALAALAAQALATREALEQQYVQAYQAELPTASSGTTYLPPAPVLASWHGPKLTLGALRTRGLLRLLGPETSRIKALRQRDLIRYTGSDQAVARMITQFLDQPNRGESTWAVAQHWELPDPVAITDWNAYYAALANTMESRWQQFNQTQTQIDDVVMDWYGFDSAMRATIRAGLPWARRRGVVLVPALAPMRVASATLGSTQRQAVQSSNIDAIGYDSDSQTLEIEFSTGVTYQYQAVPLLIWQQFEASKSKGTFYSKRIRGKYEGQAL